MSIRERIAREREDAQELRWEEGIPARIYERDGLIVWSKVDDKQRNLTVSNSEGLLFHVRSLFVPHGAENPLERYAALAEIAKDHVVVPREPTEAMLDAGTNVLTDNGCNPSDPEDAYETYTAMIEAAEAGKVQE